MNYFLSTIMMFLLLCGATETVNLPFRKKIAILSMFAGGSWWANLFADYLFQ